jgi:hypothetical protein
LLRLVMNGTMMTKRSFTPFRLRLTDMKKKTDNEDLIHFTNEREVKMVEFDVEIDSPLYEEILEFAKKHIIEDEAALLNWAIVKGLTEGIKRAEAKLEEDSE